MKILERDRAVACRTRHPYDGFQGSQRHAHIRGMRRDALVARAQNRVDAVVAVDRRASAAGIAFVARCRRVVEVITAGALEQVAAVGRHVAKLRRRSGENGFGQPADSASPLPGGTRSPRWNASAPRRNPPSGPVSMPASGRRVISMSLAGLATFSLSRSTRFVPPAMKCPLPFALAFSRTASATPPALVYAKLIMAGALNSAAGGGRRASPWLRRSPARWQQ